MTNLVLILHDIRSTYNVGSLFRTAECMGVSQVLISGYTPYPLRSNDDRLPHISHKLHAQIEKTALGTTSQINWTHTKDLLIELDRLRHDGYQIVGLEQDSRSIALPEWHTPEKVALLIGREVEGIADNLKNTCDTLVEIPQLGAKESLNVVQATAIALYHMQFAK